MRGARLPRWAWGVALLLLMALVAALGLGGRQPQAVQAADVVRPKGEQVLVMPPLPHDEQPMTAIRRHMPFYTIIPPRPRVEVVEYTVQPGDALFTIAKRFGIKPETLLWANPKLESNPDLLAPGMVLKIPPVDGVLYKWEEGDTFESVAAKFKADPQAIVDFIGNHIDLLDPKVEPGQWVMVPGGRKPFRSWVIPIIPDGNAGVSLSYLGPGYCTSWYGQAGGTGTFIWPVSIHRVVGNPFAPWHLALDLATWVGEPIRAADSGVVAYAGWSTVGYGFMVLIDHRNGYQTLYAHLSQVNVSCGQGVFQGQTIGLGGSTGNSSGPHLHFEVRYMGGLINPWSVLPPP